MQATAKDLRFHAKELIDAVTRGEEVVITFRGVPRAKLVPYGGDDAAGRKEAGDELFGIWRDRDDLADVDGYIDTLRRGRF